MHTSILLDNVIHASPNPAAVPGAAQLQQLLGGAMWLGLAGCVIAVIMGAVALGIGRNSGNPHWAERGKVTAAGGFFGALLIGSAAAIVQFAFGMGQTVSGN